MDAYLTVEETAETLKVSIASVRRWLRTGKMRGNRYGRVWRVPASELRRTGRLRLPDEDTFKEEILKPVRLRPIEEIAVPLEVDDMPRRNMKAFLRLADDLAPLIATGQKQPITGAKISDAIDAGREERDQEINGR